MLSAGYVKARAIKNDDGMYAVFVRSANEKPSVAVRFEIIEGEEQGEKITWFGYFTGGAADISIKALRALGLQGDDITEAMIQPLTNEVSLTIIQEEYEGKVRAKVQFVNPIGGGNGGISKDRIMSKEEVRTFAALMRAKMGGAPAVKPQAQQKLPTADDDTPF